MCAYSYVHVCVHIQYSDNGFECKFEQHLIISLLHTAYSNKSQKSPICVWRAPVEGCVYGGMETKSHLPSFQSSDAEGEMMTTRTHFLRLALHAMTSV